MDDQPLEAPWARLYRAPLRSGASYPVQPAQVADALRATRAQVGSASFLVPELRPRVRDRQPTGILLLGVSWHEDDRFPYQEGGGRLWLYAVPAERRQEVRALLLDIVLPQAARWLADAAARGPVWREMLHERWYTIRDGALAIEDREGGSWGTVRRS